MATEKFSAFDDAVLPTILAQELENDILRSLPRLMARMAAEDVIRRRLDELAEHGF